MKNKTELINILKAELTLLAQEIIKDIHKKNIKDIYKSSRKLYEKTNAINQLLKLVDEEELENLFIEKADSSGNDGILLLPEEELPLAEEEIQHTEIVSPDRVKPEKKDNSYLESDSKNKSLKKEESSRENIYKSVTNMKFIPKTEQRNAPATYSKEKKHINIGLNDKIAFIRHLFNNDSMTYNKVIEHLNEFDSYEDALKYINEEIKPKYNNWDGKDEYEFRLIQLLELKFN